MAEKVKERDLLYVSKKDPERLKKIQKEIDFFFYGIENN